VPFNSFCESHFFEYFKNSSPFPKCVVRLMFQYSNYFLQILSPGDAQSPPPPSPIDLIVSAWLIGSFPFSVIGPSVVVAPEESVPR